MPTGNDALLNKIQQNLSAITSQGLAASKAKDRIAGAAAAARGQSKEEIRRNSPFLERVFGEGATIAGANEMFIQQGVNSYISDVNKRMKELREYSPEMFEAMNVEMFSAQMTGDSEVDDRMTLAAQESMTAAAKIHAKEHLAYVQEQALAGYNGVVSAALDNLDATLARPGADQTDIVDAQSRLLKSLKKPDAMNADTHRAQLIAFTKSRHALGDQTVNDLVNLMGIQFTPDEMEDIENSRAKGWKNLQERQSIALSADIAKLEDYSNLPDAQYGEILRMAQKIAQTYGPDAIGKRLIGMLTTKVKKDAAAEKLQRVATQYAAGQGTGFGPTGIGALTNEEAIQGHEAVVQKYFGPDGMVTTGKISEEEAWSNVRDLWKQNQVVPPNFKRKISSIAAHPLTIEKLPSQDYIDMVKDMEPWMQKDSALAAQLFGDSADFQRYSYIRDEINHGTDPAQAIVLWQDKSRAAQVEDFTRTREYGEAESALLEQAANRNIDIPFIPDDTWPKVKDTIWFRDAMRNSLRRVAFKSGSTENLAEAAWHDFMQNTEFINGYPVTTNGTPLSNYTGVDAKTEDVINFFLEDSPMFDPYDKSKIKVNVNPQTQSVFFTLEDDMGVGQPTGKNSPFARNVNLSQLGELYKQGVLIPKEKQQLMDNLEAGREKIDVLKRTIAYNRELSKQPPLSDAELTAEAMREAKTESELSAVIRDGINKLKDIDFSSILGQAVGVGLFEKLKPNQ